MSKPARRIGLWLIGCYGSVSTTVAVGTAAIAAKIAAPIGMITTTPDFHELDLDPLETIIIGGHDIRPGSLFDSAKEIHLKSNVFTEEVLNKTKETLAAWCENVRPGIVINAGAMIEKLSDQKFVTPITHLSAAIQHIQKDLQNFKTKHQLDQLIVINISSTEKVFEPKSEHQSLELLQRAIDQNRVDILPASSIYAYAAIEAGFAFVNFTPSLAASIPAIQQLALQKKVPIAGNDGKTGETLLKAALAPMFVARNLHILSWVGHNILGAGDGMVLSDPSNKSSKVQTKDSVLSNILGYKPQTHVSIEYIESMEGWKTAWDHIHFAGFLNTKMTMQFTWQGCDSMLAAPLVLDIARLTLFAQRRGEFGILRHLACFFKGPLGVEDQDFFRQYALLQQYILEAKR